MKINIKPFDFAKGSNKIHFDGFEIEMNVEEISLYYENLDKMEAAMNRFAERMEQTLLKASTFEKESHNRRMEYLNQQDKNDAAYMQRRKDQEVLEHKHWIEKYGRKEDTED